MLLTRFWPNFKGGLARSRHGQGKVKARLRQGQGKVRERSGQDQGKVKERSKQGQGKVRARSGQGQGKIRARSRKGQGKVKVKSRQHNHNLNLNYNLMGFDTIEINLVFIVMRVFKYYISMFPIILTNHPPASALTAQSRAVSPSILE